MRRLTRPSITKSIARSAFPPRIARAETKILVSKAALNDGVNAQDPAGTGCLTPERDCTLNYITILISDFASLVSGRGDTTH
jgi:hypothetical protein